jgi:hypothetical protein
MKCQTKHVDFDDYAVAFSPAQKARMEAVFPRGVCDFSRPGVKQAPIKGTWLEFADGS